MKLCELLYENEYSCGKDIKNLEIKNVTSRSDNISEGTLFVAIKGIKFDTGKIINYILSREPVAIVCDEDFDIEAEIPLIRVRNARRTLALLCSRFNGIDYSQTRFIGVTGTNGKTTTATMIYEIMLHAGYRAGIIGTGKIEFMRNRLSERSYSMTTPDPERLYSSIKKMQLSGCEVIVMEASSHALALDKLAPINFSHSLFTNLSPEHMDFHTDMEDYYEAKLKLFTQSEIGIFNADDKFSSRAMNDARIKCTKMSVGALWDADAMARDVILNGFRGSSYIYRESNLLFRVKLSIPGYYNVYNSLLALKCAISFGIKPYVAKEAVNNIKKIDGRFEIVCDDVMVIIDYAHTEHAFENILKSIKSAKKQGQNIITVFGCGGDRDKSKRPKMASVAEKYSDFIIVTQDNPRGESEIEIISDILSGIKDTKKRKVITSRSQAISHAILNAQADDIIIILGKGHERYCVDKYGYHEFDERTIIRNALETRRSVVTK